MSDENTTPQTSREIINNAVEQKALLFLQNTADTVNTERLSSLLLRNQAMMKWLDDPGNIEYSKVIKECQSNDVIEKEVVSMFDHALKKHT